MNRMLRGLWLGAVLLEAACAGAPRPDADGVTVNEVTTPYDPAERINRKMFGFNMAIDHHLTKPVATAYVDHVPDGVRQSVHHFSSNLGEPKTFVNDILQGNLTRSAVTTGRFVVNSTAGVAGLFDVAASIGLPHHEADFGQTFGVWGVRPGPSVQLPLLGTSTLRDTIGTAVGFVADPLSAAPGGAMTVISAAGAGGGVLDGRAKLLAQGNALEKTSLDYYATLRSINAQRRAALVADGRAGLVQAKPDVQGEQD